MASRAALRAAARQFRSGAGRRQASTSSAEASEYPVEGFHSVLWPLTAGLALSGFMAYRFAPDTSSITDYIAYYFPDRKVWTERNDAYLEKVIVLSEDRRLLEDAEAPKLRRRRFPQMLTQASPHAVPVGADVDTSNISTSTRPEV